MTPVQYARECVRRGWPVFPAGPDKAPLTPHGFHDASRDRNTILGWFRDYPDALLAIPTGRESGLLILDIDPAGADWYHAHATDLKCGYVVRTQRGHHLYYTLPAGIEIGRRIGWLPGVDVLGGDGYAIAWFAHGYEAIGDMDDIGPPPPWLLEQLQKGNGNSRNSRIRSGNGSAKITESNRNNHLTQLAGLLASQGHDEAAIRASLRAENAQRLDPPLDDSELLKTVLKSAGKWVAQNRTAEKAAEAQEPEPLRRLVPPAPDYPLAALGGILGPAAKRIADTIQAPAAICGQSLLAAASLAVQPHADVLIDGRREPLSLWCISIAESGERKSAADDIALEPHRIHERVGADQHRRDMIGHEADVAAYKEQRKHIMKNKVVSLKAVRDVNGAIKDGLHKLGTAPSPPLLPWLLISTPTLEGLHKLYDRGRPSLGLFHDDGGEFVGGHSMSADHRMKSAAGLSKLWDRGEFDRVRGTDGAHKYYGRRLALHLMVQPVVAETLLGDPLLCGQGFLARTLLCWPGTRIGTRQYLETDLQTDPALIEYRRVMMALLDRPSPVRPEAPQELEPRALQLAPDAKRTWIALHDHFEDAMREGGELAGVRAWGSKAPAQVLRIAGVLTLVANPGASVIRTETIAQAAELVLHALEEAVRLVGTTHVPDETRHAQLLLEWCHASGLTLLHSGAALQLGPNPIRTKTAFDAAIRELERAGWAVPLAGGAELDGKLRRRVWEIHS